MPKNSKTSYAPGTLEWTESTRVDRIKRRPEKFKGKRLVKWVLVLVVLGILIYLGTVMAIGL